MLGGLINKALGAVNGGGKLFGGLLRPFGLDQALAPLLSNLSRIPGFNNTMGGLLAMVPKLLDGEIDLTDAIKIGSLFMPPPAGAIASMADLSSVTGAIVDQVGDLDTLSPGHENLLRLAQRTAFELAGEN